MLCFISNKEHNEKPLMVHGFSIGAYMFGITMKLILQDQDKYGELLHNFIGLSIGLWISIEILLYQISNSDKNTCRFFRTLGIKL